jgi:hypothetical protein
MGVVARNRAPLNVGGRNFGILGLQHREDQKRPTLQAEGRTSIVMFDIYLIRHTVKFDWY